MVPVCEEVLFNNKVSYLKLCLLMRLPTEALTLPECNIICVIGRISHGASSRPISLLCSGRLKTLRRFACSFLARACCGFFFFLALLKAWSGEVNHLPNQPLGTRAERVRVEVEEASPGWHATRHVPRVSTLSWWEGPAEAQGQMATQTSSERARAGGAPFHVGTRPSRLRGW